MPDSSAHLFPAFSPLFTRPVSRTNAPFVRRVLAPAYVLVRDYRAMADARSDAFYPARSNGRRFPVAIVGYGFPFDFGTSRSAKFHGREIFCARALIQA